MSLVRQIASACSAFRDHFEEWCEREPLTFESGDYHPPCGAIYDASKPHFCIRDLTGRCTEFSCINVGRRKLLNYDGTCKRCGSANVKDRAAAWPLSLCLRNSKLAAVVSLDAERRRQKEEVQTA